MASSLSNFADNLAEGIHKIKCKIRNTYLHEYRNTKDNLVEYICLFYNESCQKVWWNVKKDICQYKQIC